MSHISIFVRTASWWHWGVGGAITMTFWNSGKLPNFKVHKLSSTVNELCTRTLKCSVRVLQLWSLEIHRFTKIVNFDTAWVIPLSFKFLYISLKNRRNTLFEKKFQSSWIQLLLRGGQKMSLSNTFVFF